MHRSDCFHGFLIILLLFTALHLHGQAKNPVLKVSGNGRYLMTEEGDPFFWLGDTGWLLFSKLNREEAEQYLDNRARKGFNVVQVMVLHSVGVTNFYGDSALVRMDVSQPRTTPGNTFGTTDEYDYWDHVDYIIDLAGRRGIYMALVPIWGSNVRAGAVNREQAASYASWLARRYGDRSNIIWLNGGDVRGSDSLAVWNTLGEQLDSGTPGQLITFHPFGRTQSSTWFHQSSWLDFNMFQSGHRRYDQDDTELAYGEDNWRYVQDDWNRLPVKPTLDGEPSYEAIPEGLHDTTQPRWDQDDVRRYAYWSVFAGGAGFTYGHSAVMQMHRPSDRSSAYGAKKYWYEAVDDPGARQMIHLKNLMLSRPYFERIPDQSLIAGDQGVRYDRLLATRGSNYAMVYTYTGRTIPVRMGIIGGPEVEASWYNPRTGKTKKIGRFPNSGTREFDPPGEKAEGNDWILMLDSREPAGAVLDPEDFRHYVDYFNRMESENIAQAIPNDSAWTWMRSHIPLFECPQDNFEEIFYYRWWTLRKHIIRTPSGAAFTEFLVKRSYADTFNLISCAAGHHTFESRWLLDPSYATENIRTWLRGNGGAPMEKLHSFSSWLPFAVYQFFLSSGDEGFVTEMLPDLERDYRYWEQTHRTGSGLFWQFDVRDGMEEQISGDRHRKNCRPTINSYMYGNAVALANMSRLAGEKKWEDLYLAKADTMKSLVEKKLWNPEDSFFETLLENGEHADVREAIGFLPWYVNLPSPEYGPAWNQLADPDGFLAPFGITTAERRHPGFRSHGCCNCEWDGAVWPFATSQTLTALANYLNTCSTCAVDGALYFNLLDTYVESQYYRGRPYIGEYLDETTGYWLKGDQQRSRYYNHSTFNDLIITGLAGLRPRADQSLEVAPLLPPGQWDWFCLDRIPYHGHLVTIVWDRTGEKYLMGKGLTILADGKVTGHSDLLERVVCDLTPPSF